MKSANWYYPYKEQTCSKQCFIFQCNKISVDLNDYLLTSKSLSLQINRDTYKASVGLHESKKSQGERLAQGAGEGSCR